MPMCPACGSNEPEDKRFCGECGARLESAALDGGRERKVVTVLFCDLVAFTAASDGADPEEIQARLSPYHARCRQVIERFGGTVEKFIGDAVMAAFGAPTVHEDDPERAVRAGLALLDAVEELNTARDIGLSVRIGVATGEAVVSVGARPSQGEGMLAGDVVNTAARLQSAAPVGRVLVGQDTYVATMASIEYEPHDPISAKGKAEPIPVWVAVASRGSVGEDLADRSRPMIGREDELTQLQRSFTRAVRESSVQLVTIVAEPGLGKSRLVQAFADWIDAREELVTWRQGKCRPYGDAVAYAALADIVKAQTGILDSDAADLSQRKLDDTVRALVEGTDLADQASWLAARLAPLVALPASEAPQEELFTAWRRFLEALAATGPLVLVIEDLHWADPAMLDFLTHLLEWTVGVPLVIVATARPELYDKAAAWGAGHRNANTLTLIPLDAVETAQLVTSLLGTRVLPADLHAALLAKADGNPLYAREYLTILTEQAPSDLDEVRVKELAETLPGSVQAVIAARLDTLLAESKQLLQAAAVIGHTFWSGAVSALTGTDEAAVRSHLHDLVRRDYLRPSRTSRIAGQDEYTFGHALIADVAYGQLPRLERARHHQNFADWLAARVTHPDISADAPVVAHHYTTAHAILRSSDDETGKLTTLAAAANWHTHAAENARRSDISAAINHARVAVELTEQPSSALARRLLLLGDLHGALGQNDLSDRLYRDAERSATTYGDVIGAAHAQLLRSEALLDFGHVSEADALRDSAISTLEQQPASQELALAYAGRSNALINLGRTREAVATAELAIKLIGQLDAIPPRTVIWAYLCRGNARVWAGDSGGVDDLNRAKALAEQHHLTSSLVRIYDNLSTWKMLARSANEALPDLEASLKLATSIGIHAVAQFTSANLAELLGILGRGADAVALCEQAAVGYEAIEQVGGQQILRTFWAWVLVLGGHLESARRLLDELPTGPGVELDLAGLGLLIAAEWENASGQLTAQACPSELIALLEQPGAPMVFVQYLPRVARCLAATERLDLVEQVFAETPVGMVFYDNNRQSARAVLAQAQDQYAQAADLHEQAATAWAAYGYPLEQAHALIGAAQCRSALGEPARHLLEEANDILERIGARPLLAETERLLTETSA